MLAETERLPLAGLPVRAPLYGDLVALATREEALAPGQPVALAGARQHLRVSSKGRQMTLADGTPVALSVGDRLALLAAPTRTLAGGAVQSLDPDALLAALDGSSTTELTWTLLDRDGRDRHAAGRRRRARAVRARARTTPSRPRWRSSPTPPTASCTTATAPACGSHAPCATSTTRETVRVNANVAPATHGETVSRDPGQRRRLAAEPALRRSSSRR